MDSTFWVIQLLLLAPLLVMAVSAGMEAHSAGAAWKGTAPDEPAPSPAAAGSQPLKAFPIQSALASAAVTLPGWERFSLAERTRLLVLRASVREAIMGRGPFRDDVSSEPPDPACLQDRPGMIQPDAPDEPPEPEARDRRLGGTGPSPTIHHTGGVGDPDGVRGSDAFESSCPQTPPPLPLMATYPVTTLHAPMTSIAGAASSQPAAPSPPVAPTGLVAPSEWPARSEQAPPSKQAPLSTLAALTSLVTPGAPEPHADLATPSRPSVCRRASASRPTWQSSGSPPA